MKVEELRVKEGRGKRGRKVNIKYYVIILRSLWKL